MNFLVYCIVFFTISMIIKKYFSKITLKNSLRLKNIKTNLLSRGYDKNLIEDILNSNNLNIKNIYNKCLNFLNIINQQTKIISKINKTNKVVIIMIGENGSGKTSTCFKLARYFQRYHEVLLCTADTYKKPYEDFYKKCKENNSEYIVCPKNVTKMKNIINIYLKSLINDNFSLMIVDTSGRNINNLSLKIEIVNLIEYFKEMEKNTGIKIFVCNCVNVNNINNKPLELVDLTVLNHVNLKNVGSETFNSIKLNENKNICFINYNNQINQTEIFNKNDIIQKIAENIQNIIDKTDNN